MLQTVHLLAAYSQFWLNFAIEGDTEENYAESEFVMSGIKKLQINPFSIPVPLVASAVKI